MEPDCQVTVRGLPEPVAQSIGEALFAVVKTLAQARDPLDLRRMRRIVVTTDFAGELTELSRSTTSGNPITYTHEEYAIAVGKLVALPRGDGDYELLLVIDARIAAWLALEDSDGCDSEDSQTAVHLLHHELCHVHVGNKIIDTFPPRMARRSWSDKDMLVRPLAEGCWDEYVATIMSSATATKNWLATMADSFESAIARTKQVVDHEILSYRCQRSGNPHQLLLAFHRHGWFLAEMAARILGYMDGLGVSLPELSSSAADRLSGSYFEATWQALHGALKEMRRLYPDGWNDLSVYDNLAAVVEKYYARMGLVLSTVGNGKAYVHVPFRPETSPNRAEST